MVCRPATSFVDGSSAKVKDRGSTHVVPELNMETAWLLLLQRRNQLQELTHELKGGLSVSVSSNMFSSGSTWRGRDALWRYFLYSITLLTTTVLTIVKVTAIEMDKIDSFNQSSIMTARSARLILAASIHITAPHLHLPEAVSICDLSNNVRNGAAMGVCKNYQQEELL